MVGHNDDAARSCVIGEKDDDLEADRTDELVATVGARDVPRLSSPTPAGTKDPTVGMSSPLPGRLPGAGREKP